MDTVRSPITAIAAVQAGSRIPATTRRAVLPPRGTAMGRSSRAVFIITPLAGR